MRELAQLLVPAIRWDSALGFEPAMPQIARAVAAGVGGFVIERGTRDAVGALSAWIRRESETPPLLVMDPQMLWSTEWRATPRGVPSPAAVTSLRETIAIRRVARAIAREVVGAGCNAVLAPSCDVARRPTTDAFGTDPAQVAIASAEWIDAAQAEGVLCIASRFPGGGPPVHTESGVATIRETDDVLYARDLVPFRAAIDAGVAALLIASVAYAALDASGNPAALSPAILGALLRTQLGFEGLTVADAARLTSPARHVGAPELVGAGIDLVMRPVNTDVELRALMDAVASRRLDPEHVHGAAQRRTVRATMASAAPRTPNDDGDATWLDETAERVVTVVRGRSVHVAPPVEVAVVGATEDAARELARALAAGIQEARSGVGPVRLVPSPTGVARTPLIVVAVPGPNAERDATTLGDEAHRLGRDAIVVWCQHPARAAMVSAAALVLACWDPTAPMLRAVGRWLVQRLS